MRRCWNSGATAEHRERRVSLGRRGRYDTRRQALMRAELERVVASPGLSRDVYEIASKSLASVVYS